MSSRTSTPRRSPRRTRSSQSPSTGVQASSPLPYAGEQSSSSQPSSPQPSGGRSSGGVGQFNSSPLPYGTPRASTPHSLAATPSRRGDIGRNTRTREFDLAHSSSGGGLNSDDRVGSSTDGLGGQTSDRGNLPRTIVWGTDIVLAEAKSQFTKFFKTFRDPETDSLKYMVMLEQIHLDNNYYIDIDCQDLREFDSNLCHQLIRYPQEIIPMCDVVVNEQYELQDFGDELDYPIQVRPWNKGGETSLRELNPEVGSAIDSIVLLDIDQVVCLQGMVIRTSTIIPDPKEGYFECKMCKHSVVVPVERGQIDEPRSCQRCKATLCMKLIHNRCKFADKQLVKVQESPEHVPDGQTPQTIVAYAYDDLVDSVHPGDRVEITGIYKASTLRLTPRQRTVKAVFKTHLDVIHFRRTTKARILRDGEEDLAREDPEYAAEVEQKLLDLAAQPDITDRLVRAFAPNIYEFDDVKRGVLCQLFGGTHKDFNESGRGRFRGEINVLLCGDPSTSKSQMLQYAVKLAPRSIYTSGKGSSAVGLTAYVTRDPETKQIVLESGALVLCDGGVCCIDEFDKMSESTRVILHEVMEQQTVSIAKAGIIASLNARTSVLAAANPQDSRWNPRLSIVDNIQLPPTLLSRFDLIYLILDTPDPRKDQRLAKHLVSLYLPNAGQRDEKEVMNKETLAQYISYARRHIHPELSEEASNELVKTYVDMRKTGNNQKTITATPRQLESLVRLAEAHARMRFSKVVTKDDVLKATELMKNALQQAATDPRTGLIDMDLITTGQSAASRSHLGDLYNMVTEILKSEASIRLLDLRTKVNETADVHVSNEQLSRVLEQLQTDEYIRIQGGLRAANPTIRAIGTSA